VKCERPVDGKRINVMLDNNAEDVSTTIKSTIATVRRSFYLKIGLDL
jgi:hypothetical protein